MKLIARFLWRERGWKAWRCEECGEGHVRPIQWRSFDCWRCEEWKS